MKPKQNIERLINADNLFDYHYFVEFGFASGSFLTELQGTFQDSSKEKYAKATRAFFEMQIVRGILNRDSQLENGLDLVNKAREKGKPHISVALLQPEKKFDIEIPMPYEEVESLAEEFINSISCPDYVAGRCRTTCQYNMIWTIKTNCHTAHRTAYELLKRYAGRNPKTALHSMMKIKEKH